MEQVAPLRSGIFRAARHSVRQKLMIVVFATTLIALLVSGAALVIYDVRTYQQSWVSDLTSQADILGRASAPALAFDDVKVAEENLALLKVRPKIHAAAIYTAKGNLFAKYVRADIENFKFPERPRPEGYQIEGDKLILFKSIEDKDEVLGTVYIQAPYELIARLVNYLVILGGVMALSLVVALLMTAWMQSAVTQPILAMSEVARQVMARRDFSLRVRKTTEDEIGYLVDMFNDMLAEVGHRAQALEESNRTLQYEMTERRGAEKALLAADKRKDEFLATLAHELRNPLAPLRNALEILRSGANNPRAAQAAREMMERQLRQLVHLVNDLLDVSRITTGKMTLKKERVELRDIVQNALETAGPMIDARKHNLTVNIPAEPIFLDADSTRIAQVFLNLLNNAAKFTDPGGRIVLTATVSGHEVTVTVTDSGIGIPQDMLPIIFGMFAQVDRSLERPYAGLGVGLTLAKHLVELHGGTLEVSSEGLGRGSCFTVRMPVSAGPVPDPNVAATAVATRAHGCRILVADDNLDFALSFAIILRSMGHEVVVAHDGQEALDTAASFKPEVVFLDIGLPKLDGYQVARELRARSTTQYSRLIAVTGWGQDTDKKAAAEAGFDHHLVKPVEPEQIAAILNAYRSESRRD